MELWGHAQGQPSPQLISILKDIARPEPEDPFGIIILFNSQIHSLTII